MTLQLPERQVKPMDLVKRGRIVLPDEPLLDESHPSVLTTQKPGDVFALLTQAAKENHEIFAVHLPMICKKRHVGATVNKEEVGLMDFTGFAFDTEKGTQAFLYDKGFGEMHQIDLTKLPALAPMLVDRIAPRESYDHAFKQDVKQVGEAFRTTFESYSGQVEPPQLLELVARQYQEDSGTRPSPAIKSCWENILNTPNHEKVPVGQLVTAITKNVTPIMDAESPLNEVPSAEFPDKSPHLENSNQPGLKR